jgi:hypothetical protein
MDNLNVSGMADAKGNSVMAKLAELGPRIWASFANANLFNKNYF